MLFLQKGTIFLHIGRIFLPSSGRIILNRVGNTAPQAINRRPRSLSEVSGPLG
jgi:hypothetical protein